MRPNLLLIVFDTARADAFEPYGAAVGSTPVVADLASSGDSLRAYSTASWTVPAHISLFTGLLPRAAGFSPAGSIAGYRPLLERLGPRLLPSVLSEAGYHTAGLSTNVWVSALSGFDTGFEEFELVRGWRTKKLAATRWRTRFTWYLEALRARIDDGAEALERRLAARAARRDQRPFFWFVNLVECHSPYLPPKPFNDLGPGDRVRAARDARRHLTMSEIWRCSVGGYDLPDDVVDRMRRLYAGSIRQLDDWLARVLDLLDRHGVLADTQVMVTSDHGENLGDGALLGHAFSLDDRLLKVPLVSLGPAAWPVDGPVSLAAVPSFLARAAGLSDHPFPEAAGETTGIAVAEFDAPLAAGDARVAAALEQWGMTGATGERAHARLTTSFACATDGRFKLLRRNGHDELVDLAQDPLEEHPVPVSVSGAPAATLASLRAALDAAAAQHVEARLAAASWGDAVSGRPGPTPEETAEIEAQLRLLGYL